MNMNMNKNNSKVGALLQVGYEYEYLWEFPQVSSPHPVYTAERAEDGEPEGGLNSSQEKPSLISRP